MVKAIIFDFGGVIVQTEALRLTILQNLFHVRGIDFNGNDEKYVGLKARTILEQFENRLTTDQIQEILNDYHKYKKEKLFNNAQPVQVTVDFIRSYQGSLTFAIASMNSLEMIRFVLKKFSIDSKIKVITALEDIERLKPDPEVYLKTLQKLQMNTNECIAIEDSPVGAQAAIAAGISCYILKNHLSYNSFNAIPIAGYITNKDDFVKLVG